MSEHSEAETIDVEELEEKNDNLRGQVKRWKSAFIMLGFASLIGFFLAGVYTEIRSSDSNSDSLVAWQTAYAMLVESNSKCGGVPIANAILSRNVSGWPDLSEEEARFVFGDWRGDVRGGVIAPFLRKKGVEKNDRDEVGDDIESSNDAEWRSK